MNIGEYRRDWAVLLSGLTSAQQRALEACVGFHSGKNSVDRMRALLATVQDLAVPWELAEGEFQMQTLPKFALLTQAALPNNGLLDGDCFGALVSLTFNRGASYSKQHDPVTDPKDRYREMRAIKATIFAGEFEAVPRQIKSMIRIWEGTAIENGMRRRRVDEAELFLTGLAAGMARSMTGRLEMAAAAEEPLPPQAQSTTGKSDEDFWVETTEDDVVAGAAEGLTVGIAAPGARWAADDVQPDYAHLGGLAQRIPFDLKAEDLELLASLNEFDVSQLGDETPVLFGLRGSGIVTDHTSPEGVVLVDERPDHTVPCCTIGVWTRRAGTIAVFSGSTVPNQNALAKFKNEGTAGNLLPTGLYHYVCGPHITSHTTPGCFLLRMPDMSKRVVVVRRSQNDLSYQKADIVDRCAPGDNIHPTFFSTPIGFSSLGCQTVIGTFKDGVHSGPWAEFRKAVGFSTNDGEQGRRYLYMLLTGAEARMAARLRQEGLRDDPIATRKLRRLRFGSTGDAANRLQVKLNLADPDGQMGPFTIETLHRFQVSMPGGRGSDGIYTPELDSALGWRVFGSLGS